MQSRIFYSFTLILIMFYIERVNILGGDDLKGLYDAVRSLLSTFIACSDV